MKLTDLLTETEWDDLVRDSHERFGISCAVADADGVHVSHYENACNRICTIIKNNPDAVATICAAAMKNFTAETKATGKPAIDECDIALVKVAVPIVVGDTFLGTVSGCGLLPEDGEVEDFLVHKTTGITEDQIAELAKEIPTMTEARAGQFADYLAARVAEVISRYESKGAMMP